MRQYDDERLPPGWPNPRPSWWEYVAVVVLVLMMATCASSVSPY